MAVLLLVAEGILTKVAERGLSSHLMAAQWALKSLGLVILSGLLIDPILGESPGRKGTGVCIPKYKRALARPKDNTRWHSKQGTALGSRAPGGWPLNRGPPEASWPPAVSFLDSLISQRM